MATTMKQVRAWLEAEEVDYPGASKLGAAAIPFLKDLVKGGDLNLASKATYLVSLIKSTQSAAVLETAAASSEPLLRVAAASGMRNLPEKQALKVVDRLRKDADAGIRKVMLQSALRFRSPQMAAKLRQIATKDPEPFVRELAASVPQPQKRKKKKK